MFLVDIYMLTKPDTANPAPAPIILVDGRPIRVLTGRKRIRLYAVHLVQQFIPPSASLAIGLHLSPYVVVVLEECKLCNLHGIIGHQRISADPCLDGRTAPTVDNDALWHIRLFEHADAQKRAQC